MNPSRLMTRIRAGDLKALAALYDRYGRKGYALAVRRCEDRARAERIVRQVFLDLWVDPTHFARSGSVEAELLRRIWVAASHVEDWAE